MLKRIICSVLAAATVFAFASCGCAGSNTIETRPPESKPVDENVQDGEMFGSMVVGYTWVNEDTNDTIKFDSSGTFEGKIAGKNYKGTFDQTRDKENVRRVILGVTLDGSDKKVEYYIDFGKTSEKMTLTTDDGTSESYVQDWTLKKN